MNVQFLARRGRMGVTGRRMRVTGRAVLCLAALIGSALPAGGASANAAVGTAAATATADYYVANTGANTVSEVDTSTGAVVGALSVVSPVAVVADSAGRRLYVSSDAGLGSFADSAIFVFDTATNALVATIPTDYAVTSMALADGVLYGTDPSTQTVDVVTTFNDEVTSEFPLSDNGVPFGVSLSPDSTRAYVVDTSGDLLTLNTDGNQTISTLGLGIVPREQVISPNGKDIYVYGESGNTGKGKLIAVDAATGKVTTTRKLSPSIDALAVSPDGSTLYAADDSAETLILINASSLATTSKASLPAGSFPDGIAADTGNVYVSEAQAGAVADYNLSTHKFQFTTVGSFPGAIVLIP
jgi:sugar lactone lactonase YvrE